MAPTLGNFALWLSLIFAISQFYNTRKKNKLNLISMKYYELFFKKNT